MVRARVEAPIGALDNARAELTDVLAAIESEPPAAPGDAALSRTPEVVLRAMARVLGDAEVNAEIEHRRSLATNLKKRLAWLYESRLACISELAFIGVTGRPPRPLKPHGLQADYQARLAGTRSLDAPPPEPS
jgi:hypothetical protein